MPQALAHLQSVSCEHSWIQMHAQLNGEMAGEWQCSILPCHGLWGSGRIFGRIGSSLLRPSSILRNVLQPSGRLGQSLVAFMRSNYRMSVSVTRVVCIYTDVKQQVQHVGAAGYGVCMSWGKQQFHSSCFAIAAQVQCTQGLAGLPGRPCSSVVCAMAMAMCETLRQAALRRFHCTISLDMRIVIAL